ncbi:hypothetical protein P2318_14410 [Myxococcaceae bacterium GXIMD 01537]
MSENPSAAALSPRLEEILHSLPDTAEAGRLRDVFLAAAQAMAQLSDMDLVRYEVVSQDSSPDLSLWEEMAPVIRDTVMDVNGLLNVLRERFPEGSDAGTGPAFTAARVMREAMAQMAQGITQLGETMRNPSVVSDRWALLAEIQRVRGRFREQVGGLVFDAASVFADVTRQQVVPGHDAAMKAAVTVRAIVADLGRIVGARLQKARDAEAEDLQWHAQQLQGELDAFGRTGAYRGLRAQDKRRTIELRRDVSALALEDNPSKARVLEVVEALEAFVRSLSVVNQRQMLIQHDREVWAACGVRLEQALGQLAAADEDGAARALNEAASAAQALYGREPALDTFLRKARKTLLSSLRGPELRNTVESFQQLMAQLAVA